MSASLFKKVFSVDDSEYGFVAEDIKLIESLSEINLVIPKLMGALSTNNKSTGVNLNLILQNSSECKPSFGNTINFSQSIKVPITTGINLSKYTDNNGILKKGTRLVVHFVNGNVNSAYI